MTVPIDSARLRMDHATLIAVERTVEEIERNLKYLTMEVSEIDRDPTYICDCSCNVEIADLQSDLAELRLALAALNLELANKGKGKKNKAKKRLRKEKKKQSSPAEQLDNSHHTVAH